MRKIAIIGVGKLGLCFALNLERAGYSVWGIEANETYLNSLQNGSFKSPEPDVNELLSNVSKLHLTNNLQCIVDENITDIFIMVATPSLPGGTYDHSQVERVAEKLNGIGNPQNQRHIYMGCTAMPGYCNQLGERMTEFGYTVSYNPEFIAQGAIIKDQLYPDQVLIGEANQQAGNRLEDIYRQMVRSQPVYCRMDPLSAEIAKLATNCFLTTKISFANSIGDLATKSGANPDKILAAIGADSRIGYKYLGYGFGFGGPCFPRDNRALGKFAEKQGYPLIISKATDVVNDEHFEFQLQQYLTAHSADETIVFEGVAYKKGTTQLTESQQLRLAVAVAKSGRKVTIIENAEVAAQLHVMHPGLFEIKTQNPEG
jgi:UDPglucose 6-dehydrogenase